MKSCVPKLKTRIINEIQKTAVLKWDWAGHVCPMPEELWAKITSDWFPKVKRPIGRPRKT